MPKMTIGGTEWGNHSLGFRHTTSTSFNMMNVVMCKELVAGDIVNDLTITGLNTLAPMPTPLNGKINGDLRCFFVPSKVVWDKWDEYITAMAAYTPPNYGIESLKLAASVSDNVQAHYNRNMLSQFGIPMEQRFYHSNNSATAAVIDTNVNIMPLRAYQLIWWDWYRDSNVIPDSQKASYICNGTSVSSTEVNSLVTARFRAHPRNLFTTALKNPSANKSTTALTSTGTNAENLGAINGASGSSSYAGSRYGSAPSDAGQINSELQLNNANVAQSVIGLRTASAMQTFLEKCNILGGRLLDRLRGMTHSTASTVREDMSQYIGGSSYTIDLDTKETATPSSVDGQAGQSTPFGLSGGASVPGQRYTSGAGGMSLNGLKFHADVAGYLIVINTCSPDFSYYMGLDRMWMRGVSTFNKSVHDFLDESFSSLGYQPIYLAEVTGGATDMVTLPQCGTYQPTSVFGYSPKYADYTYSRDIISGDLIYYPESMQSWHLGRNLLFEAGIIKSDNFFASNKTGTDIVNSITRDTISNSKPSNLVINNKFTLTSDAQDKIISDFKIKLEMTRPLPSYVVPRIDGIRNATPTEVGGTRF